MLNENKNMSGHVLGSPVCAQGYTSYQNPVRGAALIYLARQTSNFLANPKQLDDVMKVLDPNSTASQMKISAAKLIDGMISNSGTKQEENDFNRVDFALLKNSEPELEQAHPDFSSNTDFAGETSSESWDAQERSISSLVQEARMKGYEGEACHTCQQFTMVRNGSCLKCASCGATSGCS